ncbi:hypothetical protein CXB51_014610 [Gossypium anomalum]|uniref:Uncharacterized protein n=1 Tax=Gossypium anomalum TaxID=47600 RepID=A0A8J6D4Z7_9ROSI|nr:hypothetical protein CXB51_014610 [Gossypium anomalum]
MNNNQTSPSKAPLEEICILETLGISLAPSRGLMDNTFGFPFQLHSQRSEQRPKPIRKAQLYGEDDPRISHGKPFLWCPSSAF